MANPASVVTKVFDTKTTVPDPNNTLYQGQLGTFTEFPAFPRIGISNSTIATRGQSKPVWTYPLPDGSESRVGTSGVYAMRAGSPVTGASLLGAVPGFEYYSVPGAPPGTRFDQFPGAPAVGHSQKVVFKGNYTDPVSLIGKTGIFFRWISPDRPKNPVTLIANSDTIIPGQVKGGVVRFGSTAPPSASARDAVFLGLDNEESPTLGGIYRAPWESTPPLETLVKLGRQVPGEAPGTQFSRLGEALSYDGRFVAFWGSWGSETRDVTLYCPEDGQAAVIAFCKEKYPLGYVVTIPVHQGFFVHDAELHKTRAVVKTGSEYSDFLYWVFSGRPPGVGDDESEDFEDPRWRASAFTAVYRQGDKAQVAFKGRKPTVPTTDGIYLTVVPASPQVIRTVVDTNTPGTLIDPESPAGTKVISVGVERDALRKGWLAITASMLNATTSESWAGVYVTRTKVP